MSLDAGVFCDCFEAGRVRTPPPQPELVFIDETGQVLLRSNAEGADQDRFDAWMRTACEHGYPFLLAYTDLGNIARIDFFRSLFEKSAERFPILLRNVVYNGSHTGDFLDPQSIEGLATEIENLRSLHCAEPLKEQLLREFESRMEGLVKAARQVMKPIVFL